MSQRNSGMPVKRYFLRTFLFLLLPITLVIVLHSCNKQDQSTTKADQDQRSNELDVIRQRINRDGLTITVPVNQKLGAFYADSKGNPISDAVRLKHSTGRKTTTSIISSCDFSNFTTVTIGSYSMTSNCQTGFTISWNYTISSNNNIVITSPVNSALQSSLK